nr:hypothetical protein [uncultured Flavobacterium sp.]
MNPIVKNILAVVAGLVVGNVLNMCLIQVSGSIIPPPPGTDVSTPEGLIAAMPLFEPKHFIFPFLAHALGTLFGAYVAARIAATHKMRFAMGIGIFFLIGGIFAVSMIPAPLWFDVTDLVLAYLPMAYLGGRCALKSK